MLSIISFDPLVSQSYHDLSSQKKKNYPIPRCFSPQPFEKPFVTSMTTEQNDRVLMEAGGVVGAWRRRVGIRRLKSTPTGQTGPLLGGNRQWVITCNPGCKWDRGVITLEKR
jgi:hypothetical protein